MRLATIYTLYGRRAGAELLVERTLTEIRSQEPDCEITVFCNKQARDALAESQAGLRLRYVPWLDRQVCKAFWLELLSQREISKNHFDLFWLPSGMASFPGRWTVPSVATFLDMGGFLVRNRFRFSRTFYCKHFSTPRTLRRASALTAISQTTADDLLKIFPKARSPHIIRPGVSPLPPISSDTDPRDVIKKETGLDLSSILFAPARTDYLGKGRDILLRAYAKYRSLSDDPAPLLLPGPMGVRHDLVMKDIAAMGLEEFAIWPGRVSDGCISAFYSISRMMILPSRTEGFGFPILEAMERGVPVVCSDAGSLPEVAGDAAVFCRQEDVDSLLEAILRVERDSEQRKFMVQKGHEQCRLFSWETMGRKYMELFKAVSA